MPAKAPFADCDHCPLRARPFAPSSLVDNAELLIVSDAPGTTEVIEGGSLVGPTGDVVRQALRHIGVNPRRVARTNAVLCRPMLGDTAPAEAISACANRLAHDIATSGARHIIAAGGSALEALDLLAGRSEAGGTLTRAGRRYSLDNERSYTATVNPAYLFHNDEYTPTFLRHLRRGASGEVAAFDPDRVAYAIAGPHNFERIAAYVDGFAAGAPLAFDVETDHLQWFATPALDPCALLCLVFTLEDWRSIIIPADFASVPAVRERVIGWLKRYRVIGHNVKFDQTISARGVPLGLQHAITAGDDTMLMHYALQELGAHGLKELAADYLGAPDYETDLITSWFRANGMAREDARRYSALPRENLYKYAAIDGACTLQLWRIFDAELKRQGIYDRPYRETIMRIAGAIPTIEQTGIGIDPEQLATARIIFEYELAEIVNTMGGYVLPEIKRNGGDDKSGGELIRLMTERERVEGEFKPTKTGKPGKRPIFRDVLRYNPGSNPQTSYIIYNLFGLQLQKRLMKPTGTNTGKEALEALPDHPFVNELRKYRRISKMVDTYITGIERRLTLDKLIHVDFRITGTEIGRLSAINSDHGIPRPDDIYGAAIRSLFVAPDSGDPNDPEVLVIADYSQAELRAFAHLASVRFLLDKYAAGLDVHDETALMLEQYGVPLFRHFAEYKAIKDHEETRGIFKTPTAHAYKAIRTVAKNVNFGNIYQGGPEGIAGMLGGRVSVPALREVLSAYHALMPEAADYARAQFELLRRQSYVETVFGRRRRFYILNGSNTDEAKKSVVHMVVAGSAADLNNHSAARLVDERIGVCHLVHDSIIARARRSAAERVAARMNAIMVAVGNEAMPNVPWLVDVEISDRWVPSPEWPLWYRERYTGTV
jgi:uracil-DNA glycosylase family 4